MEIEDIVREDGENEIIDENNFEDQEGDLFYFPSLQDPVKQLISILK